MLIGEIHPRPLKIQPVILSQRFLRWIIALLLLLIVGGLVFSGTQISPIPFSVPVETNAAKEFIDNGLPADAPVLIVFDYDAALAGEVETIAGPFIDYMLVLKHPRLALLASTPIGTGLSERFMTYYQVNRHYQAGQQYVNLGFLPGGAAGVLAFAGSPATVTPVLVNGQNAWETPALLGVSQLSDFAAILLLTSDAESARIWIEQTELDRGSARMLVLSSAQAGPMIQPYAQSGQVTGMVTGLNGGAPIEQLNGGQPGRARRYWDAYGAGLLAAFFLISIGSLWGLGARLRARRGQPGEG
jgi:hypothetical protein